MSKLNTITIRIATDLTLWEAVKWRIAGKEFREVLMRELQENLKRGAESGQP